MLSSQIDNMRSYLLLFTLLFTLLLSCNREMDSTSDVNDMVQFDIEKLKDDIVLDSLSKVEVIKFESNPSCLIGTVDKFFVTQKGIYIFDRERAEILRFDNNGNYLCRIGEKGHSANEYVDITTCTTNSVGDSIFILDNGTIKIFDCDGHFVKKIKYDFFYIDDFVCTQNALYCGTFHRNQENIVLKFDYNNDTYTSCIKNSIKPIKGSTWYMSTMQQDQSYICMLDIFTSSFYIISKKDHKTQCIRIISSKFLDGEKNRANEEYLTKFGNIRSYCLCDGLIRGTLYFEDKTYSFKINISEKKMDMSSNGVSYNFDGCYNGVFYNVFPPEFAKRIVKRIPVNPTEEFLKIQSEFLKVNDSINNENFYLLKMHFN